jgi:hypothetical protein
MLYVFLWLLCALAASYIYHGKRRSWIAGGLAGLIFGPIGILLALLTRPLEPPPLTKQCPACNAAAPYLAHVCPACGADIHYA